MNKFLASLAATLFVSAAFAQAPAATTVPATPAVVKAEAKADKANTAAVKAEGQADVKASTGK